MFNSEARWDRELPGKEGGQLNEPIRVGAWFECGKIIPQVFFWNHKPYKIDRVNFFWQARQGREVISNFSVQTSGGSYQISFNNYSLSWRLNKIL
ncbi:MAG: hypothetical protein ACOY3D_05470 [Candidatus Omnitrophota bacterium]